MTWRVPAVVAVWFLAACGGTSRGEPTHAAAGVAGASSAAAGTASSAGSSSEAGSSDHAEAGSAGVAPGGAAGMVDAEAGGAAGADDEPADGGEPSSGGSGAGGEVSSAGGSEAGRGGAGGATSSGGSSSAGAGGAWTPPDPDCQPSVNHALPLKCMPPQPINCSLPEEGQACTGGYGACPASGAPSALYCHPNEEKDYSLCPPFDDKPTFTALLKSCPKGTCGTDAGFACNQTTVVGGKYEHCPCVQFGSILPYKCGQDGTVCPPGVKP